MYKTEVPIGLYRKLKSLEQAFSGLFPKDNPKNARFSINFFTLIGLGGLTDELRDFLKKPKPIDENENKRKCSSSSSTSSSSSSSSSSSTSSSSTSSSED